MERDWPRVCARDQPNATPTVSVIITTAISAASNAAIMAMINTTIIMGTVVMAGINTAIIGWANSTIIIGTAIMAASNASIVAAIIIRLLDDAGRFDVERMDHAGKR